MFRRRPLMRAAVVGGAAYHMGKRSAQHQQDEAELAAYQQQDYADQQQTAAPAGAMSDSKFDELQRLAQLKEQGILTDAEFEVQKAKILAS
jgi:putative oligomerization/nucleic acid binding protein